VEASRLRALQSSELFAGIDLNDIASLLQCLGGRMRTFARGGVVCMEGDRFGEIGIVVDGRLHLTKEDVWGNSNLIDQVTPGELFAEAVVCSGIGVMPVTVSAASQASVLLIDFRRIVSTCPSACPFHTALITNMISVIARRNMALSDKMEHITKRTTRDKLLSYLSEQAKRTGSREFDIPFNRQQLADYLSVERSALSAEMSRMRGQGIIDYRKDHFVLTD